MGKFTKEWTNTAAAKEWFESQEAVEWLKEKEDTPWPYKVWINPVLCEAMLEMTDVQRDKSLLTTESYTEQMTQGEWDENFEGFKIDKLGNLQNGQHRAQSSFDSKHSYWDVLTKGVDPVGMRNTDNGRRRSYQDTVSIFFKKRGISLCSTDCNRIASIARYGYSVIIFKGIKVKNYPQKLASNNKNSLSFAEFEKWLALYGEKANNFRLETTQLHKKQPIKLISESIITNQKWLTDQINKPYSDKFWNDIVTGRCDFDSLRYRFHELLRVKISKKHLGVRQISGSKLQRGIEYIWNEDVLGSNPEKIDIPEHFKGFLSV